jgi:hypothetical protein
VERKIGRQRAAGKCQQDGGAREERAGRLPLADDFITPCLVSADAKIYAPRRWKMWHDCKGFSPLLTSISRCISLWL